MHDQLLEWSVTRLSGLRGIVARVRARLCTPGRQSWTELSYSYIDESQVTDRQTDRQTDLRMTRRPVDGNQQDTTQHTRIHQSDYDIADPQRTCVFPSCTRPRLYSIIIIIIWKLTKYVNEENVYEIFLLGDRTAADSFNAYWHHTVVCLSVCLSVTLCTVVKWYILQQKCLNKWIGSSLITWSFCLAEQVGNKSL